MNLLVKYLIEEDNKPKLIVLAMGTLLYLAMSIAIIGYYIAFRKKEHIAVYVNKNAMIGLGVALIVNLPILIIAYIFGFAKDNASSGLMIALIIISFVISGLVGLFIWFFLYSLVIGISGEQISFLGEYINISKISHIVKSESTNRLVIHYIAGTRNKKKTKFSLSSQAGQFILEHKDLLSTELIEE